MTTQGKRLKKLRDLLGFDTQQQLADAMGIEKSQTISRIENDKNGFSDKNLLKLIDLCKEHELGELNLNWLLMGKGEMFVKTSSNHCLLELKDRFNLSADDMEGLLELLESGASRDMVFKFIQVKKGNKEALEALIQNLQGIKMIME